VGQAIEAWQALRPGQPQRLDRKTNELVDLLFSLRAQPVAKDYINRAIIPALCGKAGVPTADVKGKITSHRPRSTIASQLYNAKEPMTLFELQAWLGHRTPSTTHPTTNAPRSTTGRPPWTHCSTDSPTPPPQLAPHHARSEPSQPRP
jgi:integrase